MMNGVALLHPASVDDLERIAGKAEIVNGKLVLISPTSGYHGMAGLNIAASLKVHQRQYGGGVAFGDKVGFVVSPTRSFSPDAAWFVGPQGKRFLEAAPALAVEIRSEGQYGPAAEREMAWKRADYFAAGTQVVWDVDVLREELIRVYRPSEPENPTIYRRGEIADAEPAVTGWRFPVDELFD